MVTLILPHYLSVIVFLSLSLPTGELGDDQRLLRSYCKGPQSCRSKGQVRQQGQLHCRVEVSARAHPSVMTRFRVQCVRR